MPMCSSSNRTEQKRKLEKKCGWVWPYYICCKYICSRVESPIPGDLRLDTSAMVGPPAAAQRLTYPDGSGNWVANTILATNSSMSQSNLNRCKLESSFPFVYHIVVLSFQKMWTEKPDVSPPTPLVFNGSSWLPLSMPQGILAAPGLYPYLLELSTVSPLLALHDNHFGVNLRLNLDRFLHLIKCPDDDC